MSNGSRNPASSLILLRHRVTGATLNFDRNDYEAGKLESSGYNPKDWLTAEQLQEQAAAAEETASAAAEKAAAEKAAAEKAAAEKAAAEKAAAEKAAAEKKDK